MFSPNSFVYADTAAHLARVLSKEGRDKAAAMKLLADAIRVVEESGADWSSFGQNPSFITMVTPW